jgi:hypothetical protein
VRRLAWLVPLAVLGVACSDAHRSSPPAIRLVERPAPASPPDLDRIRSDVTPGIHLLPPATEPPTATRL